MGTDIWSRAEVRRNGQWHPAPPVFDDEDAYHPCGDRHYALFACLASVRNSSFGFTPIQRSRGLPYDMAWHGDRPMPDQYVLDKYGADFFQAFIGDHNHGWVSLRELLTYQWPSVGEHPPQEVFREFFGTIRTLLWLIVPESLQPEAAPFVDAALEGDATAAGVLSDWLEERDLPSLDDVRIIFGFDS